MRVEERIARRFISARPDTESTIGGREVRSMRVTGFSRRSFLVPACLLIPLLAIDGVAHLANAQQAEFQDGIAEIAAKHGLGHVWFRAERTAGFTLTSALAALIPMRRYASAALPSR
jgi:hypothetical protein